MTKTSTIRKSKKLNKDTKWAIIAALGNYRNNGEIIRGGISAVARQFDVNEKTIRNVVKEYDEETARGNLVPDLTPGFVTREFNTECTEEVQDNLRSILVDFEGEVTYRQIQNIYETRFGRHFSLSTVHSYLQRMGVFECTNYVKPTLTIDQKIRRLEWILDKTYNHRSLHKFYHDKLTIHVDEKWFYGVKLKNKLKLLPDMDRPDAKTTQHKAHITKLMFLCAIAVPQTVQLRDGTSFEFDGKIGIWPFAKEEPCKNNSKNRPKGTLVFTPYNVTSETYMDMILNNLIPAIKQKMSWHEGSSYRIYIQQDGAKPHTGMGSPEALYASINTDPNWKFDIVTQPAQSPDLNKNDLCFFSSLQADAEKIKEGKDFRGIFNAVKKAYDDYETEKLSRVDALLFETMRNILMDGGGNQYLMTHSNIRKRQKLDPSIVVDYAVPEGLINYAKNTLRELYNTKANLS